MVHYDGFEGELNIFVYVVRLNSSKIDGPHNDWGHTARNYGLEHASQDWVVMTGDDNYYTLMIL